MALPAHMQPASAGPMLQFSLGVEGDKAMRAMLQVPVDAIHDMEPAWEGIRDDFVAREKRWLDSEGEGTFAPLSPAYAAAKRAAVGDQPILQFGKDMYRSLTSPGDPGFIFETTNLSMSIGTDDPKARHHQFGTKRMPQRRPIPLASKKQAVAWTKIIQEHLFRTGQLVQAPALQFGQALGL